MKTFSNVVKTALIAVIFTAVAVTVHAGGTGEQTGSTNSGPGTAAQLAAALNALNSGSASVNGNTVTLTRDIHAQKNLTVPAGVTLEITGDGSLGIHNATLTVNGTVNAPSNRIYVDDIGIKNTAVWMTLNGNGTINLKSKGTLIHTSNLRKLTLDGVTLVGIADNDNALVGVYEGGELIMKSGKITGNGNANGNGGVQVNGGSTFTMTGGTISGNVGRSGNLGIDNDKGAVFTMTGGVVGDGDITWTLVPQNEICYMNSVAYGNGRFVAVMQTGGWKMPWSPGDPPPASKLMYSTDGVNWTVKDNPLGLGTITFCEGKFFLFVGDNGAFSTDGENWTRFNLNLVRDQAWGPVYGNGKYVIVSDRGRFFYSTDGVTWTETRIPSLSGFKSFQAVAFGSGRFIAMDGDGKMAYSTDGIKWTVAPGTHGNGVRSIAYGAGRFVKIGWDHTSYSEDGLTWTFVDFFGFSNQISLVIIYGAGKFVATDSSGRMAYSTDGITWEMVDTSVFGNSYVRFRKIAYGAGRFVAVDIDDPPDGSAPTTRGRIAYSNLQE